MVFINKSFNIILLILFDMILMLCLTSSRYLRLIMRRFWSKKRLVRLIFDNILFKLTSRMFHAKGYPLISESHSKIGALSYRCIILSSINRTTCTVIFVKRHDDVMTTGNHKIRDQWP